MTQIDVVYSWLGAKSLVRTNDNFIRNCYILLTSGINNSWRDINVKIRSGSGERGFDSLSDEDKVKFRAIKELLRCQIESTTSISRSDAHKMEKQVDFLLSAFRKIVRESGGSFTMRLELPNHISYDLFALRDEYEELEDAPLGPFYEEEDLNETSNFEDSIDHDGSAHIAEQKIAA